MSKTLLKLLIAFIFFISAIVFIMHKEWIFVAIFGIIFVIFLFNFLKELNQDKKH